MLQRCNILSECLWCVCVCAVYWMAIMAPYLHMAKPAAGRPSQSPEGQSVTVIVGLFLAPSPTCMNASARSELHKHQDIQQNACSPILDTMCCYFFLGQQHSLYHTHLLPGNLQWDGIWSTGLTTWSISPGGSTVSALFFLNLHFLHFSTPKKCQPVPFGVYHTLNLCTPKWSFHLF